MPPPDNQLKGMNYRTKQTFKSKIYKDYEADVGAWALMNQEQLNMVRELTNKCSPWNYLQVDQLYNFHQETIITKDGNPKSNDTFNRPKALCDVLKQLLGIDDKWFWCGALNKQISPNGLPEYVDITFSIYRLDSIQKPSILRKKSVTLN